MSEEVWGGVQVGGEFGGSGKGGGQVWEGSGGSLVGREGIQGWGLEIQVRGEFGGVVQMWGVQVRGEEVR